MTTAEEILKEKTGHAHGLMDVMVIEAMKEYAKEVAKESLKNASENAVLSITPSLGVNDLIWDYSVDKQSILNESNIPSI